MKKKYEQGNQTTIIKYANRKLYNTKESRYTTLSEIIKMPLGSFKVTDHETNEDVTNLVLIQALTGHLQDNSEILETLKPMLVEKSIFKMEWPNE